MEQSRLNIETDYNQIFEDYYQKLNPSQKQAVDNIDGPVIVLAGPGAGKTQLLSLRVANILRLTDTSPQNILCLTFTDSGARNMQERLASIIGPDAYKTHITTFHSFAKSQMNLYPERFFGGATPKIMDDYTRKLFYKDILIQTRKNNFRNSLTSYNQEQGFVYQNSIDRRIKQLKSNGINSTDLENIINRNNEELKYLTPLLSRFFSRTMAPKLYAEIPELLENIKNQAQEYLTELPTLGTIPSLSKQYLNKIHDIYQSYLQDPDLKARPLSNFKRDYMEKKGDNHIPKELRQNTQLQDLVEIYSLYEDKINDSANIDFDDLIKTFVDLLKNDQDFRLLIQSRYHYILVDEFQDTSLIQLDLVTHLLNLDISEGRPNILVVGDDDQSIYKFQGANVTNLKLFVEYFPEPPEFITLTQNYRSTQNIVSLASQIIDYSDIRFSKIFKIDKILEAVREDQGIIEYLNYNTFYDEVADVCTRIKKLKNSNIPLSSICILSRNHASLLPFARHLEKLQIPLKYEKGQNILASQHILELIRLCELTKDLIKGYNCDAILSEVLCSQYWQIKALDLYNLAITAKKNKQTWIETMLQAKENSLNIYFYDIANWLLELSSMGKRLSAERLFDMMIGQHFEELGEQGEIEIDNQDGQELMEFRAHLKALTIFSPFGKYYFKTDRLNLEYLASLSALKTLINKVREFRRNDFLRIGDLVEFFDFHREEKIAIIDNNLFNQDTEAVNLMTGHKAKGLEFEHVFVINANEEDWFSSVTNNRLRLPSNLPYEALPDDEDDKLRLLFVAITRAKKYLYITRHEVSNNSKNTSIIKYFDSKNFVKIEVDKSLLAEVVSENIFDRGLDVDLPMSKLLRPLVEDYKMPITHLWNFLDLDNKKGPKYFLENNLLRFPCSKNASSSYGTAIHSALNHFFIKRKINPKYNSDDLIKDYILALDSENLPEKEYKHYREKGIESLLYFYNNRELEANYMTEVDFSSQTVMIGQARVTGKIDKIVIRHGAGNQKLLTVVDYKTGKGFADFKNSNKNKENYQSQLLFYKLIIENSAIFANSDNINYKVESLCLDFVEKGDNFGIRELDFAELGEEVETLKNLIDIVYKKIIDLDFSIPDHIEILPEGKKNLAWREYLLGL